MEQVKKSKRKKQSATNESDPLHHTAKIKKMLNDVAQHACEDVEKVNEPKAQALFETTAEVLKGLITAYQVL